MSEPTISVVSYQLFIQQRFNSPVDGRENFYSPCGLKESSIDAVLSWLKADFNVFKVFPNVKYKVVKTTCFKPMEEDVFSGERDV